MSRIAKLGEIAPFISFTLAVAGFAFVFLGLPLLFLVSGIAAVIFGFIGIPFIRKTVTGLMGAGLAIAGILLGSLWIVAGIDGLLNPNRDIRKTKNLTSLATATSIESAVNNFFTEYGALPDSGSRVTTDNAKFLTILLGLEDQAGEHQNPRNVKFLATRKGTNGKNGLIYDPSGKPQGLFDPWGSPYTVELDSTYGEHLHFTVANQTVDLKGRRVAVYSPGTDKKIGTSDDVRTW